MKCAAGPFKTGTAATGAPTPTPTPIIIDYRTNLSQCTMDNGQWQCSRVRSWSRSRSTNQKDESPPTGAPLVSPLELGRGAAKLQVEPQFWAECQLPAPALAARPHAPVLLLKHPYPQCPATKPSQWCCLQVARSRCPVSSSSWVVPSTPLALSPSLAQKDIDAYVTGNPPA